ncbi:MAG TPA: hypothetical protein DER56_04870 [Thermosipho africanus]|nr:hypothetical protein [Thermosipho africanus]
MPKFQENKGIESGCYSKSKNKSGKSKSVIPKKAAEMWGAVYKSSLNEGDTEETAAKKAWGVVKKQYKKVKGKWVKRKKPLKSSVDIYDVINYIKGNKHSRRSD